MEFPGDGRRMRNRGEEVVVVVVVVVVEEERNGFRVMIKGPLGGA